jgi:fused signal recognition particle receptor
VTFQGIQKGASENLDVIIVDTAGRLHTKENLMDELKKVKRVCDKALPGAPHEIILVIDANSGQNAKVQAQQFNEALNLTSLIVTKLDGTARGGVIVGIAEEVGVGVQFIGTGEKLTDLQKFSSSEYARGLLRI